MKLLIRITVLFLLLGCRSSREVNRSLTTHTTADAVQRFQFFTAQDSSFRRWYFATDTSFSYHPDSGLVAHKGVLWAQESVIRDLLWTDYGLSVNTVQQSDSKETVFWKSPSRIGTVVLALLFLFFSVWYLLKIKFRA